MAEHKNVHSRSWGNIRKYQESEERPGDVVDGMSCDALRKKNSLNNAHWRPLVEWMLRESISPMNMIARVFLFWCSWQCRERNHVEAVFCKNSVSPSQNDMPLFDIKADNSHWQG